jgi:hypothetical protein
MEKKKYLHVMEPLFVDMDYGPGNWRITSKLWEDLCVNGYTLTVDSLLDRISV